MILERNSGHNVLSKNSEILIKLFIVLLTVAYSNVASQVFENATWTGAEDNNWNNPSNWTTGQVPGPFTNVTISALITNINIPVSRGISNGSSSDTLLNS